MRLPYSQSSPPLSTLLIGTKSEVSFCLELARMAGAACDEQYLERRFGRQTCAVQRESETAHTVRESCRDLDPQALDAQSHGATLARQEAQSAAVAEATKQWAAAARQPEAQSKGRLEWDTTRTGAFAPGQQLLLACHTLSSACPKMTSIGPAMLNMRAGQHSVERAGRCVANAVAACPDARDFDFAALSVRHLGALRAAPAQSTLGFPPHRRCDGDWGRWLRDRRASAGRSAPRLSWTPPEREGDRVDQQCEMSEEEIQGETETPELPVPAASPQPPQPTPPKPRLQIV